jgi:hypothetical protein
LTRTTGLKCRFVTVVVGRGGASRHTNGRMTMRTALFPAPRIDGQFARAVAPPFPGRCGCGQGEFIARTDRLVFCPDFMDERERAAILRTHRNWRHNPCMARYLLVSGDADLICERVDDRRWRWKALARRSRHKSGESLWVSSSYLTPAEPRGARTIFAQANHLVRTGNDNRDSSPTSGPSIATRTRHQMVRGTSSPDGAALASYWAGTVAVQDAAHARHQPGGALPYRACGRWQ